MLASARSFVRANQDRNDWDAETNTVDSSVTAVASSARSDSDRCTTATASTDTFSVAASARISEIARGRTAVTSGSSEVVECASTSPEVGSSRTVCIEPDSIAVPIVATAVSLCSG